MRTATLEEIFDFDSDFHVETAADEAQRKAVLAVSFIERGHAKFAGFLATQAAHEGAKALAIIERRGSDDLEYFC